MIAVCLLTGVGVNAATDGALLDSIREFCGLPVQQKKAADEGLKLKMKCMHRNWQDVLKNMWYLPMNAH